MTQYIRDAGDLVSKISYQAIGDKIIGLDNIRLLSLQNFQELVQKTQNPVPVIRDMPGNNLIWTMDYNVWVAGN